MEKLPPIKCPFQLKYAVFSEMNKKNMHYNRLYIQSLLIINDRILGWAGLALDRKR